MSATSHRVGLIAFAFAILALTRAPSLADPGDGPRYINICQELLGPEEGHCESVTDWRVQKTVDRVLLNEPRRQNIIYTIRAIEGQTRYLLTMKSRVTIVGDLAEGTQIRGVVASLQRELTPGRYTTVASAGYGNVDLGCNCPYVDSGDLDVTMKLDGLALDPDAPNLVEMVMRGEVLHLDLEATYNLGAGIVLPGDNVRIQACVQYTSVEDDGLDGCFENGGSVRSSRACSSFEFSDYTEADADVVTLTERFDGPSKPWLGLSGFRVRSTSDNVTPTAVLIPVVPGGQSVSFDLRATGTPGTENVLYLQGDISCGDRVGCVAGAQTCAATVSNTAIIDMGPERGQLTSTAVTDVICSAITCNELETARCDDGNPCTDDGCVAGLGCTNTPRTGSCEDGQVCTGTGQCIDAVCVVPAAPLACPDDGNPCTDMVCLPGVGCSALPMPNRTTCNDMNACTKDDICVNGACTGGAAVSCTDGNPCTADVCDPIAGCINTALPNRSACDNGDPCTRDDICIAGSCISGSALSCVDSNPCTVDSCVTGFGCVNVLAPNRTPCEDGNLCTANDLCVAGICVAGTNVSCNDDNPCTADACDAEFGCFGVPLTGLCDDGNACTVSSRCALGQCQPEIVLDCDDENPCTIDSCDKTLGCVHETLGDGAGCDDGDPCSDGDQCLDGFCQANSVTACDDGNDCTTSTCLPGLGCVHNQRVGSCDDGDVCTSEGLCDGLNCLPGNILDCDDGNPCTTDYCDPTTGCAHLVAANGASCDDSDVCTAAGTCLAGSCQLGPRDSCDDGNPCTSGQCNAVNGCVQLLVTGSCPSSDACAQEGLCVAGVCVDGPARDCRDSNSCTSDFCDPVLGCQNVPRNQVPCDDGLSCTIGDMCVSGQCVGGSGNGCNDNNNCTTDLCTATGCKYDNRTGPCDDGDLCTTGDACAAGVCRGVMPVECNDGDSCTDDRCDPTTGACRSNARANGATCDDEQVCTGCPWAEPFVKRGYHAKSARPDTTLVAAGTATFAVQLDGVDGAGTSLLLAGRSDLRFVVLPDGSAVVRGTLYTVGGGADRTQTDDWTVDLRLAYRGTGKAGRGAVVLLELPAGLQHAIFTDYWRFWDIQSGSRIVRTRSLESYALSPDTFLFSAPLQEGHRANNRNLGYGAHGAFSWKLGTRAGRGSARLDLDQVFCENADTCFDRVCEGGSVATSCRSLAVGQYCTWRNADFRAACTASSSLQSGGCVLARGFAAIQNEWTSCDAARAVSFGVTGFRRLSFTAQPALKAFFPGTGWGATGAAELCDPPATSATAAASRAFALSISIGLSDAGVTPAPEGVPLGDLRWKIAPCEGVPLREIVRRAEAAHSGVSIAFGTCSVPADLDEVIDLVIEGFRNCIGMPTNITLPP